MKEWFKVRKLFFVFAALISIVLSQSVFAGSGDKPELEPVSFEFAINENDDFKPENEYSITFAQTITLNAETVRGAKVSVTVSFDEKLELPPVVYEEVTVGATLKFIQPVALNLGDNTIKLTVEKEGYSPLEIETLIKRKDLSILESLQNLIVVPGFAK